MAILRLMERQRTPLEEQYEVDVPDNPELAVEIYVDMVPLYPERAEGFYLAMLDLHGRKPGFAANLKKHGLYV